ncbi:MAG: permease [Planctomycetes bacterium]|nr:permease [Planctomycetota bacterium]
MSVFVSQASVMRYLGAKANQVLAYAVASVSGTILAVCSCTVLPLFSGIWKRGAGLGPATAFLYSGPAINVLAIVLTARVLGIEMGVARTVGAVGFSVVVGWLMHWIFRREERAKAAAQAGLPVPTTARPLWQTAVFFASLVGILVFANWSGQGEAGWWGAVHAVKWWLVAGCGAVLAVLLPRFARAELTEWIGATWTFAKQILPLLLGGVFVAGLLLGRPGHEGLIPSAWVAGLVGGNSLAANLFASVVGAFMYFATLTEIPILQGLLGAGMGQGPALALLLAGPALSLPSMLVLRSIIGTKKTAVYVALVVVMAAITGMIYGGLFG